MFTLFQDNIDVGGFPSFHKNFLCNEDGENLANQFIEHYFTIYDSNDRNALEPLYYNKALMSVRSAIIEDQLTSNNVE